MLRSVAIRSAVAEFDQLHGRGAAARDLALDAFACVVLVLNVSLFAAAVAP